MHYLRITETSLGSFKEFLDSIPFSVIMRLNRSRRGVTTERHVSNRCKKAKRMLSTEDFNDDWVFGNTSRKRAHTHTRAHAHTHTETHTKKKLAHPTKKFIHKY